MRIVIHPCLHLHDELEVSVTNFRGGDAINLNLLFFQHMIQEKPDEIKKVSGVLQLHKYCGEYEHGDGGGVYVNKAVVIDDDTEDDSEEDTEYSGQHSGDGDDYDYKLERLMRSPFPESSVLEVLLLWPEVQGSHIRCPCP